MAKKTKQQQQTSLSPEKYLMTKVRNLPIDNCFISKNFKECGECNIIVIRKHVSGNITIGGYLVDSFCLGIKESFWGFNKPLSFLDEFTTLNSIFEPISYNEAHNIIYGALAYAKDLGIEPHKDFRLAEYILEPDTDDIPLIEYEFGYKGKPFLIVKDQLTANKYVPILQKSVGNDFKLAIGENDDLFDDDMENDDNDLFDDDWVNYALPKTEYSYNRPNYPNELHLEHAELECFTLPENNDQLPKETIEQILALPRETLIADLIRIIYFNIGDWDKMFDSEEEEEEKPYHASIIHACFFLGELRAEEGLDAVLEIMRQSEDFGIYHMDDVQSPVLSLTLYYIGRNQLDKLMDFAKEPGLYTFLKTIVFKAVGIIAFFEPERRAEVIKWFEDILTFYYNHASDSRFFDPSLLGFMLFDLIQIKAIELLPLIKQGFDARLIDESCCGDYLETEKILFDSNDTSIDDEYILRNIYERYEELLNTIW